MFRKYFLEGVVFISGGVVMILELCGSRILAPYVGVSIVVWTSLIGIILGSLSIGYYFGGRIADKKGSLQILALIIFLSSLLISVILLIRQPVLQIIDLLALGVGVKAILATIILFTLPSIVLGMVSPLAVKLKIQNVKTVGGTVGNLYALSTIGSIVGTFLAGFVLLAYFSITQILVGLSLTLLVLSLVVSGRYLAHKVLILVVLVLGVVLVEANQKPEVKVYESRYNHIEVFTQGNMKVLQLDNKWNSAIFIDKEGLVFDYTKYYHLAKEFNPKMKKVLMIGGAVHTVPQDFLKRYKDIEIDVVELDPFLTELGYQEFGLKKDPRLTIYHEDGRTFLNREAQRGEKQYDVILVDAFSSFSIPFHLTTIEALSKMNSLLSEEGFVMTNVISSIEGERGRFLQAEATTYKKVFPYMALYPVDSLNGSHLQNLVLVASKNKFDSTLSQNLDLNPPWTKQLTTLPILTDDFAPVDQYVRINEM